jgi:hypothetical protein
MKSDNVKKLVLNKETLRNLSVRTGIKAGGRPESSDDPNAC